PYERERVAMTKMLIENVLKLLPLKLVIMNEFGANFFANKNMSNMSKRDKPMNIYIGNLHLHNKII
ncbi:hypothetical protein OFN12_31980, partial [Escherichia coli]|nr:hypothetical protein [Escherichia coli]